MSARNIRRRAALAVAGTAAAVALSTLTAPMGHADLFYGAIAYAPNGSVGTAYDFPSRPIAEQGALDACGQGDCKVLSGFSQCGAVANDGNAFQGGTGPTLAAAEGDALSRLGDGWIDSWACN
jgi:hypothetical protein